MAKNLVKQNCVAEWTFRSSKKYPDPFSAVELDAVFTGPDGVERRVPGFWAGRDVWSVRFASPTIGKHQYRTVCSDPSNEGLHGQQGEFEVKPYKGMNPLFQHGPLQAAADKRHLQHLDGTPLFWLGDTWWMGLCKRLSWPNGFRTLLRDRVKKGFSVIQIIAGLYPDMPQFDARGANEAGCPWEKDYARIRPAYFDKADRRIAALIDAGLVPCIVGCWGYFLEFMGAEKMKQHWRYLVARYGAYPVVWCIAGEGVMPYYLAHRDQTREEYVKMIRAEWTKVTSYVRALDSFRRPITIHPTNYGHEQVDDPSLLDFDMLQTGHSSLLSFPNTVKSVRHALAHEPKMPVLVGEVCYEGILEASREEVQRLMFWACMLSGAAGHTYGANGIWQLNSRKKPFGPSPHGSSWGNTPWEDAYKLPGSAHLGLCKKLLERFEWWRFESHPEWLEVGLPSGFYSKETGEYFVPLAAGIPGKVRLIYFNHFLAPLKKVKGFEPGVSYRAFLFNPSTGAVHDLGKVTLDNEGGWPIPRQPVFRDWVLVLEAS